MLKSKRIWFLDILCNWMPCTRNTVYIYPTFIKIFYRKVLITFAFSNVFAKSSTHYVIIPCNAFAISTFKWMLLLIPLKKNLAVDFVISGFYVNLSRLCSDFSKTTCIMSFVFQHLMIYFTCLIVSQMHHILLNCNPSVWKLSGLVVFF